MDPAVSWHRNVSRSCRDDGARTADVPGIADARIDFDRKEVAMIRKLPSGA
jgi:hypothetical protein